MKKKNYKSDRLVQLESHLQNGVRNQLISFNKDQTQITYHVKEPYTTSFRNPEEPVRAACFCELVLKYKYPADQIQFEVLTKPDKDRIDLVVYKDKKFKEPFVVVECKKDGISDAEFENAVEQAYRYAHYISAWYIIVMGLRPICFKVKHSKPGERKKNIISDIPIRYGEPPKYKYYKQDEKDLKIGSREALIKTFHKCHNTIWQGGKLEPTAAFDEMSKLLFCKLKDEKDTIKNEAYQFQIGTAERPKEVWKRITAIYQRAKQESENIFKEDLNLPPEVVFSCIKLLQDLAINKIDLDTKGLAFASFMPKFFKGEMGQYFTPRNVVKFAVDMIEPKSEMRVLDPACGSGGFLINTIDYVRNWAKENYTDKLEIYKHWHNFAKDRLFGLDINDQIARICQINMILHEANPDNFICTDSLGPLDAAQLLNPKFKKNYFDLILTNPPYGARIQSTEKPYLKHYRLGHYKNKPRNSQKTEILFIERCVEFLKPGGKMAMIVTDGILNNSSDQYVRDYILEVCQILAIVSLPQHAFLHLGAGAKCSLLFVQKKNTTSPERKLGLPPGASFENYPIFMAIAEQIGYDATGRETPDQNDLPEILKQYKEFEQGSLRIGESVEAFQLKDKIFFINRDELKDRIDPNFYKAEFINNYYKVRNIPNKPLGELIYFSKETWNQKDYFIHKFPYIEIGGINIKTGEINNISEMKIGDAPKSAKKVVRENDILISKTRPNRGAICLIDKHLDGFIASTGFAVIRKIKNEVNRKYLFYALRLNSTLKQLEQRSSGGVYPHITQKSLGEVRIPLPSKETQIQIVALMDRAYSLHKEKNTQAKQLLLFMENNVLKQLNIKYPEGNLKKKIFILMSEHIKGQRMDIEYNLFKSFKLKLFTQLKNPMMIQKFIVDYKKGIEVGSDQYVHDGIPFVRVSDITDFQLQQTDKKISKSLFKELKEKFCPKKGELLYTKDGTIGLSYVVTKEENTIISGAILRLICQDVESAKYLKIILSLKMYKELVTKKSTGTIIQHLNLKEFLKIPIPFPEKEKRDKIIREVDEIKAKVKSLRKEAALILQKTQQEVEIILFHKAD